jgi:hypothetical protein
MAIFNAKETRGLCRQSTSVYTNTWEERIERNSGPFSLVETNIPNFRGVFFVVVVRLFSSMWHIKQLSNHTTLMEGLSSSSSSFRFLRR